MPDADHTWRMPFPGLAEQAPCVREWTVSRATQHATGQGLKPDPDRIADLALLADELFIAVLATRPEKILMTLSTSGPRARVYATGPTLIPLSSRVGAGIIRGLSTVHGSRDDNRTMWAELVIGVRP